MSHVMTDVQREKLHALRDKREKHAIAAAAELELRELRVLELEEQLETLTSGKRGEEFEIVDNKFGLYGVRRPDHQAIANWDRASNEKKLSLDWQIGVLRHYILPTPEKEGVEWAQTAALRPGLCWETAAAFARLMGVEDNAEKKGR